MVHIYDANTVMVSGLDPTMTAAIKKRLSLEDPAYFKGQSQGTPQWTRERYFKYYKEIPGAGLSVPKGFIGMLKRFLEKQGIEYTYEREKVTQERSIATVLTNTIELRNYQKPIVQSMLENNGGVVFMSTGSGKSIIALDYISKVRGCATIVVKDKTLLHQMVKDCSKFLGYECGQVGDGKRIIRDITVCTIHSLQNHDETLEKMVAQTEVLIVDEIQEFVSYKRKDCLDQFAPNVFFGMTATPYRSLEDGRTDAIKFLFGDTIATHMEKTMAPKIEVWCSDVDIPVRANYSNMIEDMIGNEARNKLISGLAIAEILSGHKVLILVKRVAHAQALYELIAQNRGVYHIEQDTKDKAAILEGFKAGTLEYSCIIGTMSLLGTGFDVPSLSRVIIAGDMRSNVLVVQCIGRILRLMDGKNPVVIDICDNKNGMLKNQFKSRKKIYLSHGWNIEVHPDYMTKWV